MRIERVTDKGTTPQNETGMSKRPKRDRPRPDVGSRIIEGLTEFAEALESGEPLETRLTGHRLSIDLMPRKYLARDVRATRRLLGASQSLFARFLGGALGPVRAWEQGRRVPNRAAARLLD